MDDDSDEEPAPNNFNSNAAALSMDMDQMQETSDMQQDQNQITRQMHDDQELVTRQMVALYHQDPTPLSQRVETGNLWQFPDPVGQGKVVHVGHPLSKLFHKTCSTVAVQWQMEPKDIVPEEMRAQTPYSMALFLALRRLASNSKKQPEVGRDTLLYVWRDRIEKLEGLAVGGGGEQFFETRVEDLLLNPTNCETVIQENSLGLTLRDAATAIKMATALKKGNANGQASQPSGKLRGGNNDARRVEMRAARNERKKEKKAWRDSLLETRGKAQIPPPISLTEGSKIGKRVKERRSGGGMQDKIHGKKGYKLLQFLEAGDDDDGGVTLTGLEYGTIGEEDPSGASVAPPNSPELNSTQLSSTIDAAMDADAAPPTQQKRSNPKRSNDPDYAVHSNRHDRHNDNVLSQMFNRVDMEHERGLKSKKAKRLLAGAARHEGPLPSDRVRLAEIPTLYKQQGLRLQAEAFEGIGRMGLKGEDQEEVVVSGNGVLGGEVEDGEQGGVSLLNGGDEDEEL